MMVVPLSTPAPDPIISSTLMPSSSAALDAARVAIAGTPAAAAAAMLLLRCLSGVAAGRDAGNRYVAGSSREEVEYDEVAWEQLQNSQSRQVSSRGRAVVAQVRVLGKQQQ